MQDSSPPVLLHRAPRSRRSFLQAGALSLLGLGLSDFLKLRAIAQTAGAPSQEKAVIFIWLPGGPAHLDTYDMKPDAPIEYRGDLRPIRTNVPGVEICELFPRQARIADKFTLIRSVCHDFGDHGGAHKRFMTGRIPATPTEFVNDAPAVTSIVTRMLEGRHRNPLPPCVAGVDDGRSQIDVFSLGPAYLGTACTPFIIAGDPSRKDFHVQNLELTPGMAARLDDRMMLLGGMDRLRRDIDQSGMMQAMDRFSQRAVTMLTSPAVREAFDLSREPASVRDRYGWSAYGQRGLMARRLVEAGCPFVTMVWENPFPSSPIPSGCCYNWDSHAVNCHIFEDSRWRFPVYDQAVSALIEDLYARGLDQKVLLVVTGEFGRTPRLERRPGTQTKVTQPGRDHWPQAMSLLVSGGGMRTGQIVGATDAKGEAPVERVLSPNDLWATVYRHLGIDYETSINDFAGRPMPILPFGQPIPELLPPGA
ncbi:MAG TPA: DUF1501 domain-containing protein [Verrucomicrobiales bacterium]|nr:DUF1501 domain-containing protein [Verrucomicrobiales bacterium]